MRKEIVMRGQTAGSDTTPPTQANEEILNFSGFKPGMAYKMTELKLYPKVPNTASTCLATVTAGKTAVDPDSVDFNNDGLIASSTVSYNPGALDGEITHTIINDTFLITQNLILKVLDSHASEPVNWQCKFEAVKMSQAEESVTNYKQFMISDD